MVFWVESVVLAHHGSVVALRSPDTLHEHLRLAMASVYVSKHMDLRLYPFEGVSQVFAPHSIMSNPIEYVMWRPVRDEHIQIQRNLIPHSPNLGTALVVPSPIVELRLRRAAINLRPDYCGELVFEIYDILAVRTHEFPHRVDSRFSAQMIEKEVMIASNKNNPFKVACNVA